MYEELVKALREYAERHCPLDRASGICGCIDARNAAGAIEELQQTAEHYKGCSDDWYKEACEYKAMLPRWIPVTERLPEMGKEVLVSDKQKNVTIAWIVGCFSKDGASFEWACSDGWIDDQLPITHWMPLPEPPKKET